MAKSAPSAAIVAQYADTAETFWSHVSDNASEASFLRHSKEDDTDHTGDLLSVETLPENASFLNFVSFAKDCPERFFDLLSYLRPEFQEIAVEYYVLRRSQAFIGDVHGFIQTRTWQALRIIEQALGAMIVMGTHPDEFVLRPILEKLNLESTEFGSLAKMVVLYANSQDYGVVAKAMSAPVPAIRKIFRPAIETLLADNNIRSASVGAYLRNLTHQASLTSAGLSKRCLARHKRMQKLRFDAPATDKSPLISFGKVATLHDTPWCMLEIYSEYLWEQIRPAIPAHLRRCFGKHAAQIYAPCNPDGTLRFGYIFARAAVPTLVRTLLKIRGISDISTHYDNMGNFVEPIFVPHSDIEGMMVRNDHTKFIESVAQKLRENDFVRIETGSAERYCGKVTKIQNSSVQVQVDFPTGRYFVINADRSSVTRLDIPKSERAFWGRKVKPVESDPQES